MPFSCFSVKREKKIDEPRNDGNVVFDIETRAHLALTNQARFPSRQSVASRKRHTLPTDLVCHRLASHLCLAGTRGGHIWQAKVDHFSQRGPLFSMVAQRQVGIYYVAENKCTSACFAKVPVLAPEN
jgi:hypothetical protein